MAGSVTTIPKIQQYWDYFFCAETGTYEKSTWMDLFLSEFLVQLKEGKNPSQIISFCPVSGVVTIIGCELLCGIHRVTSSINAQYTPPIGFINSNIDQNPLADRETSKTIDEKIAGPEFLSKITTESSLQFLQKYLLRGSAWRCLVLLQALGVEGLSCGRQLSSVLIWLYGELTGAGNINSSAYNPHLPFITQRKPVYQLFSKKIWKKPTLSGNQIIKPVYGSHEKHTTLLKRKISRALQPSEELEMSADKNESQRVSSESDNGNDLEALNRSLTLKAKLFKDNIEDNDLSLLSDKDFYDEGSPRTSKNKPKAENFITEQHKQIMDSEITPFEFSRIVINLLQELCKTESNLSSSEGVYISVQCINFSLRNLCALQFSSLAIPDSDKKSLELVQLKALLTELLAISLDKVLLRPELFSKIIHDGILPMLIRLLEDVTYKYKIRLQTKSDLDSNNKLIDTYEAQPLSTFIFGVGYSINAFLYCLLMQCRNIDKMNEFTAQFKLYSDCQKGALMKTCLALLIRIPGLEKDFVINILKKLTESIGRLIVGLKRVRSEVIHSSVCARSRHKICRMRVIAGMHHHHNILGEASAGLGVSPTCCVAILYATLTSLLIDEEIANQPVLRKKVLKVMLNSGSCCCFPPGYLVENVVRLILTHNSAASTCLNLLESTIFGELGASVLNKNDSLPCAVCEQWSENCPQISALNHGPISPMKSIPSFHNYYTEGVNDSERKNAWSFLIHYNSLLQLDNSNNILHATINHLMKVTPKCKSGLKYELLFSVLYPTFIVAKQRYIIRQEEAAYFLTVSCLNIFANLLNTIAFAEHFIQKGGLAFVLELVSLPEFSRQCCSILEIAIIVEIWKLEKENQLKSSLLQIDLSNLPSLSMMIKSLSFVSHKFYMLFRNKVSEQVFLNLSSMKDEKLILSFVKFYNNQQIMANMCDIKQCSLGDLNNDEEIELLNNVWIFWRTCSCLCLYSPKFRSYIIQENIFLESYILLKSVLHVICICKSSPNKSKTLIKILEALLTVQFAVCDVTMEKSKELALEKLRIMFLSENILSCDSTNLKMICEMLIRVATTSASDEQVMPPVNKTKLPPLMCNNSSSDVDSTSSDEEEILCPYMSEGSEPSYHTADEGYEADIEGWAHFNSNGTSENMSSSEHLSNDPAYLRSDYILECSEYSKSGAITHPELCVLVVDILIKLVEKILSDDKFSKDVSEMAVSLCRACCIRLSRSHTHTHTHRITRALLTNKVRDLLTSNRHEHRDLQKSILDLVYVLASQSILHTELAAYLQLFNTTKPPLNVLIDILNRLIDNLQSNMPDFILCFPITLYTNEEFQTNEKNRREINIIPMNSISSQSRQAEESAMRIREDHIALGLISGWSKCASSVGINGWGVWANGLAVALWASHAYNLEVETDEKNEKKKSDDNDEMIHLYSIGQDSLMIEMWLNPRNGSVTFKLTRPEPSINRVLSEVTMESNLPSNNWNFIAYNAKEIVVQKKKIHIQITLFVNGYEFQTVSLPLQGILIRKPWPTSVLLGHAISKPQGYLKKPSGVCYISTVNTFRSPIVNNYNVLYMMARGPNGTILTTNQEKIYQPNYASLLSPQILSSNVDWNQVYEMSSVHIRELQENLLLSFNAQNPNITNLYHQTVSSHTVFPGRVIPSSVSSSCSQTAIPETIYAIWYGNVVPGRYRGIPPAVFLLGGPQIFMVLFAKIVGFDASAQQQAQGLSMFFKLCYSDHRLYSQFQKQDCLSLVHTVLVSDKCTMSLHMLKAFLDGACSTPILVPSNGRLYISTRSDAILIEPKFLVSLLHLWKEIDGAKFELIIYLYCDKFSENATESIPADIGTPCGSNLFGTLLMSILVLLRDDHPHRGFNVLQANRVQLIHHLLFICKERYLNSDCGPMSEHVTECLIDVIRSLMGAPPLLTYFAILIDFLLLMHQASETFVTHCRANFYFLLTSELPTTEETNVLQNLTLPFITRGKSIKKSQKYKRQSKKEVAFVENLSRSNSLNSDEFFDDDGTEKASDDWVSVRSVDDKGSNNDSANENLDSEKQLKFSPKQVNIEMKNVGKSSDTNDKTTENVLESGPSGAEDKTLTNDYVVIESDEVDKGTETMYSSGIFHQHRSIAGTTDGNAIVKGILDLLRDAIVVSGDTLISQIIGVVIHMETLLILGNQPDASIRSSVVRLVSALVHRCSQEELHRLQRIHYFFHLANQITLYPVTEELIAACLSLITKSDASLDEQMECIGWRDLEPTVGGTLNSHIMLAPLVSCVTRCTHSVTLMCRIISILSRLIDMMSVKSVIDLGIVEVLIKSSNTVDKADMNPKDKKIMTDYLKSLMVKIISKAFNQTHTLQNAVECWRAGMCSGSGGRSITARSLLSALHMVTTAHLSSQYFSTVVSIRLRENISFFQPNAGMSKSDIALRQKTVIMNAVEFIVTLDPTSTFSSTELELFEKLMENLLSDRSSTWRTDAITELFWWVIMGDSIEVQALTFKMFHHYKYTDVLGTHSPTEVSVLVSWCLKRLHGACAVHTSVTDWLREWSLSLQAHKERRTRATPTNVATRLQKLRMQREQLIRPLKHRAYRCLFLKETLAGKLTESAMQVTRLVVDTQNSERKAFMEYLRTCECENACSIQKWREIIEWNTHELGLWYNDGSYPKSWELDPTEGPGRIRVRLRRCHLDIDERFLKDSHKHNAESRHQLQPLSYIFTSEQNALHNGLLERLHINESVQFMARVTLIAVTGEQPADLLLTDKCVHVVCEGGRCESLILDAVRGVWRRRWRLAERALELFLWPPRTLLVAFPSPPDLQTALQHFRRAKLPVSDANSEAEALADATSQWRNGVITNWEYLMKLNGLAGRSYNDLMQYPVMPFILADYTSKMLDLTAESSFRDLRKPMAVQDKKNEIHYINNYNYLKTASRDSSSLITGVNKEPYHYGSHYSNSGTVLHFLVRLPPFTKQFLSYQDNNFDIPDRTFHSLQTTWRLTSCDSPTDVKELIPEFFYLPEFLKNNEGLDLGVRQCGARVEDVETATWSLGARSFILLHRQALESSKVCDGLPAWFDLVFGFKQTGQPAVDAINVFHPATYCGFDPASITDEVERDARETMVRTYGQTPRQLFKQPHPQKATDIYHGKETCSEVVCGAIGVRWGSYCGSPGRAAPVLTVKRTSQHTLHTLSNNSVQQLQQPSRLQRSPQSRSVIVTSSTSLVLQNSSSLMSLLTWGHSDHMVRLKVRKEQPPEIIAQMSGIDSLSCGAAGGEDSAWVCGSWGSIWRINGRDVIQLCGASQMLTGTNVPTPVIALSPPFGVAAVAYGSVSLWDMHTLTYIRTLPNKHNQPITCLCISETLCDIAIIHEIVDSDRTRHKSTLRVYTVNGDFVGSVKIMEKAMSICYSNAPEGISINVIAVGLDTGAIKLYSSWDLKPVNQIAAPNAGVPITSITYSIDSEQLFAAGEDGSIFMWENGDTNKKPNNVRIVSSLNIF